MERKPYSAGAATLNIYSVDEAVAFKECSLQRFDSPDEAWLGKGGGADCRHCQNTAF